LKKYCTLDSGSGPEAGAQAVNSFDNDGEQCLRVLYLLRDGQFTYWLFRLEQSDA
jgi:hypothetical protein